jgi:hypothetical protein
MPKQKEIEMEKAMKLSLKLAPMPKTAQPQQFTVTEKELLPYICKKCGQRFKHFHELGNHVRHERAQEKRETAGGYPISDMPKNIPKHYKIIKIESVGDSRRIYCTVFMPPSWTIVKAHKPVQRDGGIWVYFEPLSKGAD